MSLRLPFGLLFVFALTTLPLPAVAQLPNPALDFIFPPGGQSGTSVDVEVGGRDLDEGRYLVFSHPGPSGEQITRPPAEFESGAQPVANRFRVSIPVNMPPGRYDVRVAGRFGVSTPLTFVITGAAEAAEPGSNHKRADASQLPIDSVMNGRVDANAVDHFRFTAEKDHTLVIECLAQQIESKLQPVLTIWNADGKQLVRSRRLIDPVIEFSPPATGEYVLGVHDHTYGGGNGHYYRIQTHSGPYLVTAEPHLVQPNTRASLTVFGCNLPGPASASGWKIGNTDLHQRDVTIIAPPRLNGTQPASSPAVSFADGFDFRLPAQASGVGGLFLGYSERPVTVEQANNDMPSQAQDVALPCDIAGRFYPRRDQDWFQFDARKGQAIQVRVVSNRLGKPTDPEIFVQRVIDKDGKTQVSQVSTGDDVTPNAARYKQGLRPGLDLGHLDPIVSFTADADATYRVGMRDLNGSSLDDVRLTYHLIIEPQRRSFELLAWTQRQGTDDDKKIDRHAMTVRRAGRLPVIVDLIRQGGFNDPVAVTAKRLPQGVTASPCVIPAGQSHAVLMLSAATDATRWSGPIEIVGTSQIDGRPAVRTARGASLSTATGNVEQTRPEAHRAEQIVLSVIDQESVPAEVHVAASSDSLVWQTSRGALLSIPLKYLRHTEVKGELAIASIGLPGNIKVEALKLKPDTEDAELKVSLTDAKVEPGKYTFFLRGKVTSPYARNPQAIEKSEHRRKSFDDVLKRLGEERQAAEAQATAARQAATQSTEQFAQLETTQQSLRETLELARKQFGAVAEQLETLPATSTAASDTSAEDASQESTDAAQQLVQQASSAVTRAVDEIDGAQQSVIQLKQALATAREKIAAHTATAAEAEARQKQLTEQQQRAEEFAKQLDAKLEEAKKNLGPKDVISFVNSPMITLEVLPSPIRLQLSQPTKIRRGATRAVDLKLERQFGFTGPVTVTMETPESVTAVSAKSIQMLTNQGQGALQIAVGADAPLGKHTVVIKSNLKFNDVDITNTDSLTIQIDE